MATSQPRPSVAWSSSRPKATCSASTENDVGSCSSVSITPGADGVGQAGGHVDHVAGLDGEVVHRRQHRFNILLCVQRRQSARSTVSRMPAAPPAPGAERMMIHPSVLPKKLSR